MSCPLLGITDRGKGELMYYWQWHHFWRTVVRERERERAQVRTFPFTRCEYLNVGGNILHPHSCLLPSSTPFFKAAFLVTSYPVKARRAAFVPLELETMTPSFSVCAVCVTPEGGKSVTLRRAAQQHFLGSSVRPGVGTMGLQQFLLHPDRLPLLLQDLVLDDFQQVLHRAPGLGLHGGVEAGQTLQLLLLGPAHPEELLLRVDLHRQPPEEQTGGPDSNDKRRGVVDRGILNFKSSQFSYVYTCTNVAERVAFTVISAHLLNSVRW